MACIPKPLRPPALPGADSVFAGRGHWMIEAVRGDLDLGRQVSIYTPECPCQAIRLSLEQAAEFPVEAVVFMPDATGEMRRGAQRLAESRHLPVIDFDSRGRYGYTLIAGTPPYPEIRSFLHSELGVSGEQLIVRRGNEVFHCGCDNRELACKFIQLVLAGQPLSRENARQLALLRAKTLPEASEPEKAQIQLIRVGDVHTHTTASDGHSTPLGLLLNAPMAGLDYLVITDHHYFRNSLRGAQQLLDNLRRHGCSFPLFVGEEMTVTDRYHINVYPLHSPIDDWSSCEKIRSAADRQGAVMQLNHPMTYGIWLAGLWNGDFTTAGFDAVEQRVDKLEDWRLHGRGRVPAIVGCTDTHNGIFGNLNSTAILATIPSEQELVASIRQGNSVMLDAMAPEYAYGNDAMKRMIGAALRDPEYPDRCLRRLKECFGRFDLAGAILASPLDLGVRNG